MAPNPGGDLESGSGGAGRMNARAPVLLQAASRAEPCASAGEADLEELLHASAALHHHLCPRQVLGVRMGMLAGKLLELDTPRRDKRLLALVETDGCAADGVAAASGCWVGRRTLRVIDFGKVAATFVDTIDGRALRIAPRPEIRLRAREYAPGAKSRWAAQLEGYQRMPEQELLRAQEVRLVFSLARLLSKPGYRVACRACAEEILNEREVLREGMTLCRACAGESYYQEVRGPIPPPARPGCG